MSGNQPDPLALFTDLPYNARHVQELWVAIEWLVFAHVLCHAMCYMMYMSVPDPPARITDLPCSPTRPGKTCSRALSCNWMTWFCASTHSFTWTYLNLFVPRKRLCLLEYWYICECLFCPLEFIVLPYSQLLSVFLTTFVIIIFYTLYISVPDPPALIFDLLTDLTRQDMFTCFEL